MQKTNMTEQEKNFNLSGDEARILMSLIMFSETPIPCKSIFMMMNLFSRINEISQNQPPQERK